LTASSGILITYSGYPYTPSSFMPDNGLANLAGALIKNGHDVLILDYSTVEIVKRLMPQDIRGDLIKLLPLLINADDNKLDDFRKISSRIEAHREREVYKIYKEIEEHIIRKKVNFIGFKLWMGDGFSDSIKIAEFIKRDHPEIKIYAGGPQSQLFRETIYKRTQIFDAVCYGEGEEIISVLADHSLDKADLKDIPNIIYLNNGKIITNSLKRIDNLDSITYPVYDLDIYPAMNNNGKINIFSIDDSRGCPNNCAFCCHSSISGKKRRVKSAGRIFDEMKYIRERYHSRVMRFTGSNTPTDLLIDLSNRMIEDGSDFIYSAFSNLKEIDSEHINSMKRSGLFGLFVGIESADKRILKNDFDKSIDPDELKNTIKLLMDSGIFIVASFIYPAPSEDSESRNRTLNYILELFGNPLQSSVTVQFPGMFPQSKWGMHPERYGFEVKDMEKYINDLMSYNIKQYLPASLWGNADYRVKGISHLEIVHDTARFVKEIENNGILTRLLDEAAMMSYLLGIKPMDFKKEISASIFTADYDALKEMVYNINRLVV
jgi:radical SAM superfamily enzyme YgiQ (UPF0313 family)